jgi:hypothetical protein
MKENPAADGDGNGGDGGNGGDDENGNENVNNNENAQSRKKRAAENEDSELSITKVFTVGGSKQDKKNTTTGKINKKAMIIFFNIRVKR